MQDIVERMRNVPLNSVSELQRLMDSKVPGERLAAIAQIQKFPLMDYLDWLPNHVGDIEKPFIGYQASVALFVIAKSFGQTGKNRALINEAIERAFKNMSMYEYQDPNQIDVLNTTRKEILFQ